MPYDFGMISEYHFPTSILLLKSFCYNFKTLNYSFEIKILN